MQVKWLPKGLCVLWSFMSGTFVIPIQRHKSLSLSVSLALSNTHTLYISRLKLVIPPLSYSQYATNATSPPLYISVCSLKVSLPLFFLFSPQTPPALLPRSCRTTSLHLLPHLLLLLSLPGSSLLPLCTIVPAATGFPSFLSLILCHCLPHLVTYYVVQTE